jgi:hypothetical protein
MSLPHLIILMRCHTEVSSHRIIIELELQDKRFFLRRHYSVKKLDSLSHFFENRNLIPVATAAGPLKNQTNPAHPHPLLYATRYYHHPTHVRFPKHTLPSMFPATYLHSLLTPSTCAQLQLLWWCYLQPHKDCP